jgi:uncharacterized membrane protein
LPLTLLLASARDAQDQSMPLLLRAATFRFSTVGLFAVGTLLATGIVNAAILVGSLPALLETIYGNLLLAKIGLFAAMVCVAAINRLHLRPRLPNAGAIRQLARNTWIETGLGLSIIVIVSVLGILPPAAHMNIHNHAHAPTGSTSPDVAFVHIHSNKGMAEVTIAPDRPGVARASIRLMSEDFSPLAANDVAFALSPQAPTSTPPILRAATRLSDGTWEVDELKIGQPGIWVVKLTVKTDASEPFVLDAPIVIERAGTCNRPTRILSENRAPAALGLFDLHIIEAFRTINQGGDDPTGDEDANDREAEIRKVIVQTANDAPELTDKAELVADQSEGFDTSNE